MEVFGSAGRGLGLQHTVFEDSQGDQITIRDSQKFQLRLQARDVRLAVELVQIRVYGGVVDVLGHVLFAASRVIALGHRQTAMKIVKSSGDKCVLDER